MIHRRMSTQNCQQGSNNNAGKKSIRSSNSIQRRPTLLLLLTNTFTNADRQHKFGKIIMSRTALSLVFFLLFFSMIDANPHPKQNVSIPQWSLYHLHNNNNFTRTNKSLQLFAPSEETLHVERTFRNTFKISSQVNCSSYDISELMSEGCSFRKELIFIINPDDVWITNEDCNLVDNANHSTVICSSLRKAFNYSVPIIEQLYEKANSTPCTQVILRMVIVKDLLNQDENCKIPFAFPANYLFQYNFRVSVIFISESHQRSTLGLNTHEKPFIDCSKYDGQLFEKYTNIRQLQIVRAIAAIGVRLENIEVDCIYVMHDSVMKNVASECKTSHVLFCDGKIQNVTLDFVGPDKILFENMTMVNSFASFAGANTFSLHESSIYNSEIQAKDIDDTSIFNTQCFSTPLKLSVVRSVNISRSEFSTMDSQLNVMERPQVLIHINLVFFFSFIDSKVYNVNAKTALYLENSFSIDISNSQFLHSNFTDSTIRAENVEHFYLDDILFENNIGRNSIMSIIEVTKIQANYCHFYRNQVSVYGTILISSTKDTTYASIFQSTFRSNIAQGGGAIFASRKVHVLVTLCVFNGNRAELFGGAIYSIHPSLIEISMSKFYDNSVTYPRITENSKQNIGSGGALAITLEYTGKEQQAQTTVIMTNIDCHDNAAIRGGCIFIESDTRAILENVDVKHNTAYYAGGGLFLKNSTNIFVERNLNVEDNKVIAGYGQNKATTIARVEWQLRYMDDNSSPLHTNSIFLGQKCNLTFTKFYDSYGHVIPQNDEIMEILIVNATNLLRLTSVETNNANGVLFDVGIDVSYTFIPNNVTLIVRFSKLKFPIDLTLRECPSDYEMYSNLVVASCRKKSSFIMLMPLIIVMSVLTLLIGVSIGTIASVFIRRLMVKINKLNEREKAEREIEKKIRRQEISYIVKDTTPLLASMKHHHDHHQSYIIPSNELNFVEKIGAGTFGVCFKAILNGTSEVAVKVIQENTDEESVNQDFEKEVYLLSQLRNPHIVTFFGVCLTESKKFIVVEYLQRGSLEKLITECRNGKSKKLDMTTKVCVFL